MAHLYFSLWCHSRPETTIIPCMQKRLLPSLHTGSGLYIGLLAWSLNILVGDWQIHLKLELTVKWEWALMFVEFNSLHLTTVSQGRSPLRESVDRPWWENHSGAQWNVNDIHRIDSSAMLCRMGGKNGHRSNITDAFALTSLCVLSSYLPAVLKINQ